MFLAVVSAAEAGGDVVVDDAGGLHSGVDDDGADELEAAFLRAAEISSESGVLAGTSLALN